MLHPFINIFFLLADEPLHLRVIMFYIEILFTLMLTGTFTDSEVNLSIIIYIYIYIIGRRTGRRCKYIWHVADGNNGNTSHFNLAVNVGNIFRSGESPGGHSGSRVKCTFRDGREIPEVQEEGKN